MESLNVGVIFGGRSVEHEVSVITGLQIITALRNTSHRGIPIYISKDGEWFTGSGLLDFRNYKFIESGGIPENVINCSISPDSLVKGIIVPTITGWFRRNKVIPLDIVIPAIHGKNGEDGTLQGLLELANIPYVGCGVLSSAIGMNKSLAKLVFKENKIPTINSITVCESEKDDLDKLKMELKKNQLSFPLFIKPCSLGSSIGISRVTSFEELKEAIELVYIYDDSAIIENAVNNCIEVNCAVIGDENELIVSACEKPIPWETYLTFEDKYLRGTGQKGMASANREIPAPISAKLTSKVQDIAKRTFKSINGSGIARVDCFVCETTEEVFVNEINTMPGSLALYLWEPVGLDSNQVVEKLIDISLKGNKVKDKRKSTLDVGLFDKGIISGIKAFGSKGN
jgi:D-alanine-D-alanine ligase